MKFLTANRVREVREDQDLVHHCYSIALQGDHPTESYSIEWLDTHNELAEECGEPIEDIISVPLVDGNPEHSPGWVKPRSGNERPTDLLFASKLRHFRWDTSRYAEN